jgi:hypothetical protein
MPVRIPPPPPFAPIRHDAISLLPTTHGSRRSCADTNSPNCSALTLNNDFAAPLRCPTAAELANFSRAVANGDVRSAAPGLLREKWRVG